MPVRGQAKPARVFLAVKRMVTVAQVTSHSREGEMGTREGSTGIILPMLCLRGSSAAVLSSSLEVEATPASRLPELLALMSLA